MFSMTYRVQFYQIAHRGKRPRRHGSSKRLRYYRGAREDQCVDQRRTQTRFASVMESAFWFYDEKHLPLFSSAMFSACIAAGTLLQAYPRLTASGFGTFRRRYSVYYSGPWGTQTCLSLLVEPHFGHPVYGSLDLSRPVIHRPWTIYPSK